MYGKVVYNCNLDNPKRRGIKAVLVGEVGDMRNYGVSIKVRRTRVNRTNFKGWKFLLFLQYLNKA